MEDNALLSPPWVRYANRVEALFGLDERVRVDYDDEGRRLTLLVDGTDKAVALEALLPGRVEFGEVTLTIEVRPSNDSPTEEDMYLAAFEGNPLFVDVMDGFGPDNDVSYALFAPTVVQVPEDDTSEYCGYATLTCAELARSVLDSGDVRLSSAIEGFFDEDESVILL